MGCEEQPDMRATIGERVRTYRLRRGLTQARLAHLIGRSERWLIDVEHGEVDPRLSDAVALARVLSVSVDELAGQRAPATRGFGRPPPRPPVPAAPFPLWRSVAWKHRCSLAVCCAYSYLGRCCKWCAA
jgi:DNA-binding XRE family transcriptional regulator